MIEIFEIFTYIHFNNIVHAIDNYTAETIRQIESKYPAINTPTENVINTFNEKTKPAFNVMNSVKDTTTTTIQHGKDTVRKFILIKSLPSKLYFGI